MRNSFRHCLRLSSRVPTLVRRMHSSNSLLFSWPCKLEPSSRCLGSRCEHQPSSLEHSLKCLHRPVSKHQTLTPRYGKRHLRSTPFKLLLCRQTRLCVLLQTLHHQQQQASQLAPQANAQHLQRPTPQGNLPQAGATTAPRPMLSNPMNNQFAGNFSRSALIRHQKASQQQPLKSALLLLD